MAAQGRKRLSKERRHRLRDRLKSLIGPGRRWPSRTAFLEAATAAGIHVSAKTLSGWLDGADPRVPDLPLVVLLCDAFDISPNWLLLGDGPEYLAATRPKAAIEEDLVARLIADVRVPRKVTAATVRYVLGDPGDFYQRLREYVGSRARRTAKSAIRDLRDVVALEELLEAVRGVGGVLPESPGAQAGWVRAFDLQRLERLTARLRGRLDRDERVTFAGDENSRGQG